jgi:hypothetical protein
VAAKLLIFAALMLLGLVLRWRLRPFTDGLRALARGEDSPAIEAAMRTSHARTRVLVVAIWVGLCVAALLGIARPGEAPVPATTVTASVATLPR